MDEKLRGLERKATEVDTAELWNMYANAALRAANQEEIRYGTIRAAHSQGSYFDILPQCLEVLQGESGKAKEYLLCRGYGRKELGPFVVWRRDVPLFIQALGNFPGRVNAADFGKNDSRSHFTENMLVGTGVGDNEYANSVFILGAAMRVNKQVALSDPVTQVKWGTYGKAYAVTSGQKLKLIRFKSPLKIEKIVVLPQSMEHQLDETFKILFQHSRYSLPYIDRSA
ncbi:hypothetical protein J4219_01695 [Candidatus Woesearchaeota archaeon]|nr:hypothetical protein [Candidatus Woesearchaeota archaeon]